MIAADLALRAFDADDLSDLLAVDDAGPRICWRCDGSGEGSHEGASCRVCKGRGELYDAGADDMDGDL